MNHAQISSENYRLKLQIIRNTCILDYKVDLPGFPLFYRIRMMITCGPMIFVESGYKKNQITINGSRIKQLNQSIHPDSSSPSGDGALTVLVLLLLLPIDAALRCNLARYCRGLVDSKKYHRCSVQA